VKSSKSARKYCARVELAIRVADEQMAEANLAELAKLSDNSNHKLLETTTGLQELCFSPGKITRLPCERFSIRNI
jgi:hypothetical protein